MVHVDTDIEVHVVVDVDVADTDTEVHVVVDVDVDVDVAIDVAVDIVDPELIEEITSDVIVETHLSAPIVVVVHDEDTTPKLLLIKSNKRAAPIEFHYPNGSIITKKDLDELDPKVMSNDGWSNDNLIEILSPLLVKNIKGIKLSDCFFPC